MLDFDLETYVPEWLRGRAAITASHGSRLRALVGKALARAWLFWDVAGDAWFADGPVLLAFGGEQVEIQHQKFNDISVSWNSLTSHGSAHWSGFDLRWCHDAVPALTSLHGQNGLSFTAPEPFYECHPLG
ncbi:hypothetical protein [Streptomyces sp. BH055]|uniref:hypothetical protein n=1 Tax=Streptomyces sp. BH055 TaxID=3401173 RepID=UPI003BB6E70F